MISSKSDFRAPSEGLLPDGHPRKSDARPQTAAAGNRVDQSEELAKVARREGQRFESAPWVHKAQELPREEFKREVERHLTGRNTEASELLYFRLFKSQLAVIEQALETASLMLGSDKSRGYCLEMICADFLAGANLQEGNPDTLVLAVRRLVEMLPTAQREQVLQGAGATP